MSGYCPVGDLRRVLGDVDCVRRRPRAIWGCELPWAAQGSAAEQVPGELPVQRPARLYVQAAVDALVRHLHPWGAWGRSVSASRRSVGVTPAGSGCPPRSQAAADPVASLNASDRVARAEARWSARTARYPRRPPLALTSRLTVDGARSRTLSGATAYGPDRVCRASGTRHTPPMWGAATCDRP